MNDEFLHRLRKAPSPEFAARLKSRLDRQAQMHAPPRRPAIVRTFLGTLLLGGAAFAATVIWVRGVPDSWRALYEQPEPTATAHQADRAPQKSERVRQVMPGQGASIASGGESTGPEGGSRLPQTSAEPVGGTTSVPAAQPRRAPYRPAGSSVTESLRILSSPALRTAMQTFLQALGPRH